MKGSKAGNSNFKILSRCFLLFSIPTVNYLHLFGYAMKIIENNWSINRD